MKTINLTQHPASPEQAADGVFDLIGKDRHDLLAALNFEAVPTAAEIYDRAVALRCLAVKNGAEAAMIGGALWLMSELERQLFANYIAPVYAFSRRETHEESQADGSVRKVSVFRHVGFVQAVAP